MKTASAIEAAESASADMTPDVGTPPGIGLLGRSDVFRFNETAHWDWAIEPSATPRLRV